MLRFSKHAAPKRGAAKFDRILREPQDASLRPRLTESEPYLCGQLAPRPLIMNHELDPIIVATVRNAKGFVVAGVSRRSLIRSVGISLAACCIDAPAFSGQHGPELAPVQALALGHGTIERIVLICEELQRRRLERRSLPIEAVSKAAGVATRYVVNFHQELEEEFAFPLFEKSATVKTLRAEHEQASDLIGRMVGLCKKAAPGDVDDSLALIQSLAEFSLLYSRHLAYEDNVLLPRFAEKGQGKVTEQFSRRARELAAANGVDTIASELQSLEKQLGLRAIA